MATACIATSTPVPSFALVSMCPIPCAASNPTRVSTERAMQGTAGRGGGRGRAGGGAEVGVGKQYNISSPEGFPPRGNAAAGGERGGG